MTPQLPDKLADDDSFSFQDEWDAYLDSADDGDEVTDVDECFEASARGDPICNECGIPLIRQYGRDGNVLFWECKNSPVCSYTEPYTVLQYERDRQRREQVYHESERKREEYNQTHPRPEYTCPLCGSPMKYRTGKYGEFLGCSTFPKCRGTREVTGQQLTKGRLRMKAAGRKFFEPEYQEIQRQIEELKKYERLEELWKEEIEGLPPIPPPVENDLPF